MGLSKYEKETIVSFNEEEPTATIYTCHKPLIRKLDRFCDRNTSFSVKRQDEYSKTYQIPKRFISFRFPMEISDELRAKRASDAKRLSELRQGANK